MRQMFKPLMVTAWAGAALLLVPLAGAGLPQGAGPYAAQAQSAEAPRQISVSGTGRVDLAPDMATVRIGVTHQDEDAAAALQQTSDAVAAMLARLTELGIAPRDVQTAGLSLNPVWRDRPEQQGQPMPWGFEASNVVSLRLRDIAALGEVLDALVADGANRLDGVSFGLQDPEASMDEARRLAVADARRKATLFAEAAGVALGQVIDLTETGTATPRPQMMEMAAMRADSVPVAAGEVGITASVQMTFALE
ncbi:MAG: SIMPL domain-containing protein [Paracoccaceae bacterium]|nr:SIMPL domain-containing protein [Paracoccaceae bacterium]